jgi:hypothetical protein
MTPPRRLTVDDHLTLAAHVRALRQAAMAISAATAGMPKTGPIRMALRRHENALSVLRSRLDTAWHQVADDDVFAEHGHVYYGD